MKQVGFACEQRSNKAQTAANQQQPSANGLTGGRDSTTQLLDCLSGRFSSINPPGALPPRENNTAFFLKTTRRQETGGEGRKIGHQWHLLDIGVPGCSAVCRNGERSAGDRFSVALLLIELAGGITEKLNAGWRG